MSRPQITSVGAVEPPREQHAQALIAQPLHANLAAALEMSRDSGLDFSSRDYSWDDVLDSLQIASKEYEIKTKESRMKRVLRNKAIVITLGSLADTIPDQDGLSVLRGGLKLVFSLLQKRIENQDQILRAFEDIPLTFSKACEAVKIHPEDNALRASVEELFQTVVEETPNLINILLRRHKGSLSARLLKQHPEQEAAAINRCTDAVMRASQKVTDRVSMLLDQTVVETLQETRGITAMVEQTQFGIQGLGGGIHMIQTSQTQIEQRSIVRDELIMGSLEALADRTQENNLVLRNEIRILQTLLYNILGEAGRLTTAEKTDQTDWRQLAYLPMASTSLSMTYADLFTVLDLPEPMFLSNDVEQVLRASNNLEGLERSRWLLVTDRFRSWAQYLEQKADLILVNGHLSDITTGKISALSVIVALIASMRKEPQFVVLHHFCGLHSHPSDPVSGPRGMVWSLSAQLVLLLDQQKKGIANFPNMNDAFLQDIGRHNFIALCLLFEVLFRQLDENLTVYCVLDNISEFETTMGGWMSELCEFVDLLQRIASEQVQGPVLKVLMTTPNKSIRIYRQLELNSEISLCAGNILPHSTQQLAFEDDIQRAISHYP